MPLETATASSTPSQAANSRSKRSPIGPSESRPERSTSTTNSSSRPPSSGRASGTLGRWADFGTHSHVFGPSAGGWKAYSRESTRASQEASMMFSETPIVPHSRLPSAESSRTRVTAPVPWASSRMRTL